MLGANAFARAYLGEASLALHAATSPGFAGLGSLYFGEGVAAQPCPPTPRISSGVVGLGAIYLGQAYPGYGYPEPLAARTSTIGGFGATYFGQGWLGEPYEQIFPPRFYTARPSRW